MKLSDHNSCILPPPGINYFNFDICFFYHKLKFNTYSEVILIVWLIRRSEVELLFYNLCITFTSKLCHKRKRLFHIFNHFILIVCHYLIYSSGKTSSKWFVVNKILIARNFVWTTHPWKVPSLTSVNQKD